MTWIDQRGRLFGWLNLIDAAILVVLVACLPLGYSAWLLFKQPEPIIEAVEPSTIAPLTETRVRIRGRYLRPYLQVGVGPTRAIWLWQDLEHAEVNIPPTLPAGLYDLRLYDGAMCVSELSAAVRVEARRVRSETEQLIDLLDSHR